MPSRLICSIYPFFIYVASVWEKNGSSREATSVTGTDKYVGVKLMKNMNKPLPDGVALATSETGQRGRGLRKRKKEK